MKPFSYVTARSAASAVELVRPDGRFLAGGVDLLGSLKDGLVEAARVVNIKAVPGTMAIERDGAGWSIGANARLAALAEHAGVREALPALAQAAACVGSPQMRHMATVGGNLAQHSRCWYYRHPDVRCLKRGGGTCHARGGRNKYHALFSGCPCVSPLVSNLAVALEALDASVVVWRDGREATLPLAALYQEAWRQARVQNALRPEDLILRVQVPAPAGARSAFTLATEKAGFDWPLVTAAARLVIEAGAVREARVVLGVVAPIPYRDAKAEALLVGKPLDAAAARAAADALLAPARPLSDNAYKIPLAHALIERALVQAAAA